MSAIVGDILQDGMEDECFDDSQMDHGDEGSIIDGRYMVVKRFGDSLELFKMVFLVQDL